MKKLLFLAVALSTIISLQAQKPQALKKVSELKMPKTEDDDMPGTRGASVVWHPVQKKYYAAFAGNMGYPLAVFNAAGKLLSDEDLTTQTDVRGLWYNPLTKLISGNAYGENGWFTYQLATNGIPNDYKAVLEGMYQPDGQCVGAYNTLSKQVLFLYGDKVYMYDSKGQAKDSLTINWGRKKTDPKPDEDEEDEDKAGDYNYTTVIYTGIAGQELGLLNALNSEVELYNIKTGFLVKKLSFPEDAITETTFNFAFTNGIYWLFDMEERVWRGYK